jgi:hypothetical protein
MSLLLSFTLLLSLSTADEQPDPGFTPLFNGKNFDGWKTKPGEALEGKSEAFGGRFKVADGLLVIDPKVKGDVIIETAKPLDKEVHVKFDFLPGAGCNNDLFLRGLKFDLKKQDIKNWKEGEWNSFEIIIKGDKAEFKCNGESLKTQAVKGDGTVFGIRAEFGPMQVRKLRVKSGQ